MRDATSQFNYDLLTHWREGHLARRAAQLEVIVKPPAFVDANARPALAWAYQGIWVASCPALRDNGDPCGGVEFVWVDTPIVMCSGCWNADINGYWRPVAIPEQIAEINARLDQRAYPRNRNWLPGEPLDNLDAENEADAAKRITEPMGIAVMDREVSQRVVDDGRGEL